MQPTIDMKKVTIIMMSLCALAACNQRGQGALDLTDLDPTTSPKEDFYQYATGGWQAKNPLKPEFSRYGSFDAIAETAQKNLNELFENMASLKAEPGTVDQKISDLLLSRGIKCARRTVGKYRSELNIDSSYTR